MVRHPSSQRQSSRAHSLRRQQRVIEATQLHSHHQDNRQAQSPRQIAAVLAVIERHQKAADTLDDDDVGNCFQFEPSLENGVDIDFDARLLCRNVGCNRWDQRIRIYLLAPHSYVARSRQKVDISTSAVLAPRRDRLHTHDSLAVKPESVQ